ncbi:MAG: BT_3928 family protein [Chitinophagaceae bacterium]
MKKALLFSRFFVGILFIFSGLIKANDPMGLSYKMQEFFEVWGWHFMNDWTLAMSILMIAFEIIAGVAVIIGWQFAIFSWLLLLLILFFTFLTGYALFSGEIRECGCFGDCIKLKSEESFIKDIILTFFILFLFAKRSTVTTIGSNKSGWIIMVITVIFSFLSQWYVLRHLPFIDCLPYKVGVDINEGRKIPAGAIPDSTVITFVYRNNNKKVEFDADHFPSDFSDSTYTFIERYDKIVRKGNAIPPIKDFMFVNSNNIDTTEDLLHKDGKIVVVFAKTWKSQWSKDIHELNELAKSKKINLIIASARPDIARTMVSDIPVMSSDFVAIKTAARVDPTIYILEKGVIVGKWALPDMKKTKKFLVKTDSN